MAKNLLLEYSEELATKCELLCKSISGNSNTVFQLRKSSSSVFANITEAQYPQSLADMLSFFREIAFSKRNMINLYYNYREMSESAFEYCASLSSVVISDGVTDE